MSPIQTQFPMGFLTSLSSKTYDEQVLATQAENLLSFVKLDEASGTAFADASGNNRGASAGTSVTVGGAAWLDGSPAPVINSSHITWYSLSLRDAFNPDLFTVNGWVRRPSGDWANGNSKYALQMLADGSNYVRINVGASGTIGLSHRRGGTTETVTSPVMATTSDVMLTIVVDKASDVMRAYLNGELLGEQTGLGTWAGVFAASTVTIGAANTTNSTPWLIANVARWSVWNAALTADEILNLAVAARDVRRVLFVGDSKTEGDSWTWLLRQTLLDDDAVVYHNVSNDYAVPGWTVNEARTYIDANLAARTDDCNLILINLGSNGSETETAFKADYRAMIEALHAKWPLAPIYLARPVLLEGAPPSTPTAANATKRGWIDDLITEYAYVHAGLDETALEGGDGYTTNLTDATHYAAAGQASVATLWAGAIG